MSRSVLVDRIRRVLGTLSPGGGRWERRSRALRFTGLEGLEGRALMATINASGVIAATAVGPDFNDTITLTNASSSNSGIGTFWYAWVPGEDFLATRPISVSPPPGWTDQITNMGAGDGFAIQFVANSPADDVQPGSSLNFSFTSADSPASVNDNSVFHPGTPVDTAFVYPQGPFSDAGHQFVVTPSPTPAPAPAPTPAPAPAPTPSPAPPVTVVGIQEVKNKKHQVSGIVVDLSGPVTAAQADDVANYRLATANGKGSFTAGNSPVLRLRSAVFNPANDTVTLTLRKAFALNKPLELTINGMPPSGLQDGSGQLIDGDANGTAGGNAVALIRRNGVTLNPVTPAPARVSHPTRPAPAARSVSMIPSLPVAISPIAPAAPVVSDPTPPTAPVVFNPTPPTAPVGIPSFPYSVLDAVLASDDGMM